MEKKTYMTPDIKVVSLETESLMAAVSYGNFGGEAESGDNAAKNHPFGNLWFSNKGLFDDDPEELDDED